MLRPIGWIIILIYVIGVGALSLWALGTFSHVAHAEPPPGVSDPALKEFFHSLKKPSPEGYDLGCCDQADCRPVATRWRPDGSGDSILEVFIGPQFPNTVNDWRPVPVDAIIHDKANQLGMPIACWYLQQVYCFLDGGSS